ncbi:MAG: hypothetical protein LBJ94_00970 [Puniceicoccales bacterium]|jgi:hypothetical protein|nr:hypothetical protein [Puniceicoccales bacterium]
MPEFEEENDATVVADEVFVEAQTDTGEDERDSLSDGGMVSANMSEEERSRCALKRGRMPATVVQKKANKQSVSIDDVRNDAIGTRKDVQKSTTIVEKNMNSNNKSDGSGGACSCKKRGERSAGTKGAKDKYPPKQEPCECECKCGIVCKFFKKLLGIFGLGKKCEKCEPKPSQYRRRAHSQRKSSPRSNSRQVK